MLVVGDQTLEAGGEIAHEHVAHAERFGQGQRLPGIGAEEEVAHPERVAGMVPEVVGDRRAPAVILDEVAEGPLGEHAILGGEVRVIVMRRRRRAAGEVLEDGARLIEGQGWLLHPAVAESAGNERRHGEGGSEGGARDRDPAAIPAASPAKEPGLERDRGADSHEEREMRQEPLLLNAERREHERREEERAPPRIAARDAPGEVHPGDREQERERRELDRRLADAGRKPIGEERAALADRRLPGREAARHVGEAARNLAAEEPEQRCEGRRREHRRHDAPAIAGEEHR